MPIWAIDLDGLEPIYFQALEGQKLLFNGELMDYKKIYKKQLKNYRNILRQYYLVWNEAQGEHVFNQDKWAKENVGDLRIAWIRAEKAMIKYPGLFPIEAKRRFDEQMRQNHISNLVRRINVRREHLKAEYAKYKREKMEKTLRDFGIACGGLTVTLLTGGSGTAFYVSLASGFLGAGGNAIKFTLQANDNDLSEYIPTDFGEVGIVAIRYFTKDSKELQTIEAVYDVAEGAFFFFSSDKVIQKIINAENIFIQSIDVVEEIDKNESQTKTTD